MRGSGGSRRVIVAAALGWMAALTTATEAQTRERELPDEDVLLDAGIVDLFTLGSVEGADWEAFGRLRAIDFGPDGSLYILDQQARTVHRVASDGSYLGTIGREGGGPGEFQLPTGLVTTPAGRVVVRDTGRRSWAVFESDGTHVDNLRPDGSLGAPSDLRFAADGSVIALPNDLLMVEGGRVRRTYLVEGGEDPENVDRLPLLALDAEGRNPRIAYEMWMAPREVTAAGRLRDMAFAAGPAFDVLSDGRAVVVDSVTWEVRLVAAHLGLPDQLLRRAIEPQRVTAQLRAREIDRRATLPNQGRSGGAVTFGGTEEENRERLARAAEARLREALGFPDVRPVIRGIAVDPEGRIWVSRTPEEVDPDAPGPVDVIDASGRYLGTVPSMTLPDAFGPGGLAAWMGTGEFDVPIVEVRRITLPG